MKERPKKNEPPQFLSGWKEIATYLGKGVRTVQRYERIFGLPVRRPAGKPWGSVIATRAELAAWVKATPIREEFPLRDPHPEYVSQAQDIRKGLSEMGALRDQMSILHADVRKSVETLQNGLNSLQARLAQRSWEASLPLRNSAPIDIPKEGLLGSGEIDLLATPIHYPKAG